jgi:hypothetical protein
MLPLIMKLYVLLVSIFSKLTYTTVTSLLLCSSFVKIRIRFVVRLVRFKLKIISDNIYDTTSERNHHLKKTAS